MRIQFILAGLTSASLATAQRLLVASQSQNASRPGQILTLQAANSSVNGTQNLAIVQTSTDCGILPTWLDVSLGSDTIVCLDEYSAPNLTALHIHPDGSLQVVSTTKVDAGPVSLSTYANNTHVALAHYGPARISLWSANTNSTFENFQNFTFDTSFNVNATTSTATGSKIHQAVLDPTGKFMLFPDLGSDMIHVYSIDTCTGNMIEFGPLVSKVGSGPRHAVFFRPNNSTDTFLFVVHELSSTIVSYKVDYIPNGGLAFTLVQDVGTFGDREIPDGAKAAEIAISPDNRFVVASNRNATIFNATNPDPKNDTQIQSDSIVTFEPNNNGTLSFVQLVPSGGLFPRHFQMDKTGASIAVANQATQNVIIFKRDPQTGHIGEAVAASGAPLGVGGLAYVQFI